MEASTLSAFMFFVFGFGVFIGAIITRIFMVRSANRIASNKAERAIRSTSQQLKEKANG